MQYTLASAAKATGISETTLFQDIQSGRLSARHLVDGNYRIDASDLARIYGLQYLKHGGSDASQYGATGPRVPAAATTSGVSEAELAVLRVKMQDLEDQLGQERESVNDLRKQLNEEQAERRKLQLRLMASGSEDLQKAPSVASAVNDLWAELRESEQPISAPMRQPPREKSQELSTAVPTVVEPASPPAVRVLRPARAEKAERTYSADRRASIPPAAPLVQELVHAREKLLVSDAFLRRLADTLQEPARPSKGFLSRLLVR